MKYHFFKHLKVVLKHKHYVLINSFHLGIPLQGIVHDLSKFSFSEFIPSAKYYNGHYSPIVNDKTLSSKEFIESRNEFLINKVFF